MGKGRHTVLAGFWDVAESRAVAVVDFGFVPVALEKGVSLTLQADLCRNFL